jgi:hypothetical protein
VLSVAHSLDFEDAVTLVNDYEYGNGTAIFRRRDATEGSDYDIAVFIENPAPLGPELAWIADVETDIFYDTRALINALPAAGAYRDRSGRVAKSHYLCPAGTETHDFANATCEMLR